MEAIIDKAGYGQRLTLSPGKRDALIGIAERDNRKPVASVLSVLGVPLKHPDSNGGEYTIVAEVVFEDGTGAIYGFAPEIRRIGNLTVSGRWVCFAN